MLLPLSPQRLPAPPAQPPPGVVTMTTSPFVSTPRYLVPAPAYEPNLTVPTMSRFAPGVRVFTPTRAPDAKRYQLVHISTLKTGVTWSLARGLSRPTPTLPLLSSAHVPRKISFVPHERCHRDAPEVLIAVPPPLLQIKAPVADQPMT